MIHYLKPKRIGLATAILCLLGCRSPDLRKDVYMDATSRDAYWHQGLAEVNRYQLKQARYGEVRDGEAMLIFVKEDLNTKTQNKYEGGKQNHYPVLKLNTTLRFATGIYPYTIMESTFLPFQPSYPLKSGSAVKLTHSAQEWCGLTYTQFNLKRGKYKVQSHSYFQDEGDQAYSVSGKLCEDEIWSRIRMNPKSLPLGKLEMIPGLTFGRFTHTLPKPTNVKALLEKTDGGPFGVKEEIFSYRLEYPELKRTLTIFFETNQPYAILGWKEVRPDRKNGEQKIITSSAMRTHHLMLDYWNRNSNEDTTLKSQLGIMSY